MEYIHLTGGEAVENAGSRIASAAEQMQRAANQLDSSLHMHQLWMDDWLNRFETAIEKMKPTCVHEWVREQISSNPDVSQPRCKKCGVWGA